MNIRMGEGATEPSAEPSVLARLVMTSECCDVGATNCYIVSHYMQKVKTKYRGVAQLGRRVKQTPLCGVCSQSPQELCSQCGSALGATNCYRRNYCIKREYVSNEV